MPVTNAKYFAYGSNMVPATMQAVCPTHRYLGLARLPDHRLDFNRRSIRTGSGVADIVPAAGCEVWGALYEIPDTDLEVIDRKEGAGWAYDRIVVQVFPEDGMAAVEAMTYTVAQKEPAPVTPSTDYLRRLVAGARSRGAPAAYIAYLQDLRPDHE
jgi:gamma-glutamylcyclotransferase (GGCT)/AIG2-like uncharacterized protein YtfP